MQDTQGRLNFHDALIAVAMQEWQLSALVSFDTGFDQVPLISRLDSPDQVAAWLGG
jgi:predicted nucleic acid-binding protein